LTRQLEQAKRMARGSTSMLVRTDLTTSPSTSMMPFVGVECDNETEQTETLLVS
jgi:hypothetical protein